MELKINELSRLAGVSVRTLQYYDRIGLLPAAKHPGNGYRIYTAQTIDRLQEILLFRSLGFELKEIGTMIGASTYQRLDALKLQRQLTSRRMDELVQLLKTIDSSIEELEEGITMKKEDKFKGMNFRNNRYEEEAREKWGNEKVDEANARIGAKTDAQLGTMQDQMNEMFAGFAQLRHSDPTGEEAVRLTERFYHFLNKEIGSFYNKEVFKGLGQMYIDDERFTRNLDLWGEGTARFMRDAMANYSDHYLK